MFGTVTKTYQRTLCLCGNQRFEDEDWCAECVATSRQSSPKSSLGGRGQDTLTPPPSLSSSPGPQAEPFSVTTPAITPLSKPTLPSPESVPNIFPSTMYHIPHRTRHPSNAGRVSGPRTAPSDSAPVISYSRPTSSLNLLQSCTPENRSQSVGGYAPMAAGFARLNRNNVGSSSVTDVAKLNRPSSSTRPSLDMELRMFGGPA